MDKLRGLKKMIGWLLAFQFWIGFVLGLVTYHIFTRIKNGNKKS